MSREYVLRNYIDTVRKNYDYVLIDCMPSLGMMTINALAAADSVVIPSQPSFLSAKGLDLLLRSISKVKRSINPDLKIDGILLTMVDTTATAISDRTVTITILLKVINILPMMRMATRAFILRVESTEEPS